MSDKKADLAGPGISTYAEVEKILPSDYNSILDKKDTQKALYAVKDYIEKNLCKELNLMMVQVPLIVDKESGVNDNLEKNYRAGCSGCHKVEKTGAKAVRMQRRRRYHHRYESGQKRLFS
jgi:asparagine synthetase A